jgi:hypothetical protein
MCTGVSNVPLHPEEHHKGKRASTNYVANSSRTMCLCHCTLKCSTRARVW